MSGVQVGDVATWVASVGTVAAVSLALRQNRNEQKLRRADELARAAEKVAALEQERRQQAERVSCWYDGEGMVPRPAGEPERRSVLAVLNQSDFPIFEVVLSFVFLKGGGAGPRTGEDLLASGNAFDLQNVIAVVAPGVSFVTVASGWGGTSRQPGAEVGFTDRSGASWIRRSDGALEEIQSNAVDHYGLARPFGYVAARRDRPPHTA